MQFCLAMVVLGTRSTTSSPLASHKTRSGKRLVWGHWTSQHRCKRAQNPGGKFDCHCATKIPYEIKKLKNWVTAPFPILRHSLRVQIVNCSIFKMGYIYITCTRSSKRSIHQGISIGETRQASRHCTSTGTRGTLCHAAVLLCPYKCSCRLSSPVSRYPWPFERPCPALLLKMSLCPWLVNHL